MKYDVFISYRRDGGEYTARILRDKLTELGYSVFFDVESLRSGDFNTELYSVIENCNDFVLVLSPNALDRCANEGDWVKNEIEHAINQEKNIVPILMRGFSFPDNLPDSIKTLPRYNGLEANSQFFDAFIAKLQEFLISKPPVSQRIRQNPLFKKALPMAVAALAVVLIVTGAKFFIGRAAATYPRTGNEKNITDEVILSVTNDFTNINITADYAYRLLDRAENYLSAGESNFGAFRADYDIICTGITENKNSIQPLLDEFADRLYDTPFSPADVKSLNEQAAYFCDEWLDKARYIKYLVSDDCYLSSSEKLQVIDYYRTILEQSLVFYANCYGNGVLATVADMDYLEESRLFENAAYLEHIPFNWTDDEEEILNRINASLNSIENATQKFSAVVGNENSENAQLRQNMVMTYMLLGYSKEEAQQKVEEYQQKVDNIIANTAEIRSLCLPKEDDSADLLWYKMSHLLAIECYDDARDCIKAFAKIVETADPYAQEYIPAVNSLIDYMEDNSSIYGVMVTAYDETEHPVLEIGDLIVAFDGKDCYSYEQYVQLKQELASDAYTVTVARCDEHGQPVLYDLELSTNMPKIALSTLVYHDSMLTE